MSPSDSRKPDAASWSNDFGLNVGCQALPRDKVNSGSVRMMMLAILMPDIMKRFDKGIQSWAKLEIILDLDFLSCTLESAKSLLR